MFSSYLTALAFGLAVLAVGSGFSWYLFRAARRARRPLPLRNGVATEIVTVFELALVILGVAFLTDGVVRALSS